MKKLKIYLLCLLVATSLSTASHATIYRVDAARPNNTGNGLSWAAAKKDVQEAINAAVAGDEIWVKAGTYLPTQDPEGNTTSAMPRNKTFCLVIADVKLYGGFFGNETQLSQRNASAYPTILSGDLDGAGGTADAYHVLVTANRTSACVLDGFTITGGRANGSGNPVFFYFNGNINNGGSYYDYRGSGVYNLNSSLLISNCIFSNNSNTYIDGGAMSNTGGNSPSVSSCTFSNNSGSGLENELASTSISNCTFSNNGGCGISGGSDDRVLSTTTVTNCTFSNNSDGGIQTFRANLVMSGCLFNNNSSDDGGAIFCYGNDRGPSGVDVSGCTFNGNTASFGGGVYLTHQLNATFTNCTFSANTATNGYGGGVYASGYISSGSSTFLNVTVNSCTFSGNTGYLGGGIYGSYLSSLNVTGSSVSNNTSFQNGGGIYSELSNGLVVRNSTLSGNTAGVNGGGIFNYTSNNPAISSCTISANTAGQIAGGIYINASGGGINNCILSGNTGGISSQQDIYNPFSGGTIVPVTYSLIGAGNANYSFGAGVITGNPAFVNAASPAGPDGIFRTADDGLRIGCASAARDAGTGTTPATDILGNQRVGVIDMGAYENPGTGCTNLIQYVDAAMPANGNGYSWSSAKRDLQEAINAVAPGGEVWVKAGTYLPTLDPNGNATPTDNRDKTFYLTTSDVKIYGGFTGTETQLSQRNAATNLTILSGDLDGAGGTNDAYHVLLTKGRTAASVVDGFTITGGRANGGGTISVLGALFGQSDGGGVTNDNSNLTISNCIIASNRANAYAGGMCNMSSSPTVRGCLFGNNTGGKGGGMTNVSSSPVISSSTLSANTASLLGGGIYYASNSGGSITNTILSGNTGGPANQQNVYKDAGTTLSVSYSVIGDYSPTATNNYNVTNILTGDPFVEAGNPAGADGRLGTADDGLRINCNSIARDAGTGTTPATDILGNGRVGAIDIGAYEYQGTSCPAQMYVNGSRPDNSGTGTSWATAKKDVQAALNEVSAGGSVWVKSGTYLPTLDPNGNATPGDTRDKTFYLTSKDVKLYGGFAGTETQLSQRNAVTNVTTLSGDLDGNGGTNDAYHVLITGGRTTACMVDGFTITGGRANGSGTVTVAGTAFDRSNGGGMINGSSSPSVGNCIFSNNSTGNYGGGMYSLLSSPVVSGCKFSNNTASQYGGGLANYSSSTTITNCTFSTNTANNNGGGIYNFYSSAAISNSTFSANTASINGGGISNIYSNSSVLSNCTFNANTAGGNAGALLNDHSNPQINNCIFSANTSGGNGGALLNDNSNPSISTCLFSGNTSGSNGGGICNLSSSPSITSTTISANTATVNGGGFYGDNNSGGTITNSILSGNTGGPANRQNIYKDAGTTLSVSYSVIGDYSPTATNNYTASTVLTGDPFVEVTNQAGADGTLGTADDGIRINCNSIARDAGTGATPATDILGNGRVGAIDIGAYEYQGTGCPTQMYVNGSRPDNSGTGTSWATAKKDVQAALNEVSAGGSVWVKSGTYLPTLDPNGNATPGDTRDKTFYLTTKDVKLYGGFVGTETQLSQRNAVTNLTTLSGDLDGNGGTNDAYHVLITGNRTTACVVDGFTITGGRANGSGTITVSGPAFDRSSAGGMYNSNGSPTIISCIFGSNTAIGNGGGMYNNGGNAAVTSCTFSNNSAGAGGGMYDSSASPTIASCTFSNNTATQNGGGLCNYSSSPQLSSCIFNTNTAGTSGGGLYNLNSSPATTGCTFNTNSATVYGGGIYNEGGNATISSCTFSSNTASTSGGGLYNLNSNPSISSTTFSANTASVYGGGIYNQGGNPVLSNCALGSNTATQNGGGMYNTAASPIITNSVFSANTAGNNGGGLFNQNGSPSISSSTFSANIATTNGGGIYGDNNSGGSIINSILSGNTGGPINQQNIYKDAGTTLTVSYTLIADYSAGVANNYTASDIVSGDPLFVNAASPAGADGLFRTADDGLRIASCVSPARDAGTGTTPATDILGNGRVLIMDLGAYENLAVGCPKTLYVDAGKPNNTGNGLTWSTAKKDLQAAINAAAAGDQLWVKAGTYLPTLDPNGSATPGDPRDKAFYLTSKDVKLYGGFAGTETKLSQRNAVTNVTTLSGDLDGVGGTADAYHVLVTGGRTVACVVDGFTITGGRANSNTSISFTGITFYRYYGGGLQNINSSPMISSCMIRNNSADVNGGGMYNAASSPQISSCTFSANTAGGRGGGLNNEGGSPSIVSCAFNSNTSTLNGGGLANTSSTAAISNCTFNGNTSNNFGGGLSNGTSSNLSISNCTFSANMSTAGGGGLANVNSGILAISNCTFSVNSTSANGGGLFNSNNSRGSVTNCILSGNTGGPINRQNIYKDTGSTVLTVSYSLINDYSSTATNNYTIGAGILTEDPLFVDATNPAGADGKSGTADDGLTLRSCSPAINSGTTPNPAAAQDILNNSRVGAYDLGAYEYQSAATVPVLASATITATRMQYPGGVTSFGDCNASIARLRSQGSKPVSGTVTAKVYVQGATPMQGQIPYVRRYYDITPAAGADTATAQVTLYFTQADFDDYNTVRGNRAPLPLDAADAAGNKANIRISQEHGSSTTGLPGSYTGWGGSGPAKVLITPALVAYNMQAARWEVTIAVGGFSGFFAQTDTSSVPLPLELLSFHARIKGDANELAWEVAGEEKGTVYTLERSATGTGFEAIGTVMGSGKNDYTYNDRAVSGTTYYRLRVTVAGGRESYSAVAVLRRENKAVGTVTVAPQPAQGILTITSTDASLNGTTATVLDVKGREVTRFILASSTVLDVSGWVPGLYVLRLSTGEVLRVVKQ